MTRPRAMRLAVAVLGLAVAGCGGSDGGADTTVATPTAPGDAATTTASGSVEADVVMQSISFQPGEITVPVGTTVTWTNDDGIRHTSTSDDGAWDSGTLSEGDSFSFTFDEPGTYPYLCEIHPQQMQATVIVEG